MTVEQIDTWKSRLKKCEFALVHWYATKILLRKQRNHAKGNDYWARMRAQKERNSVVFKSISQ